MDTEIYFEIILPRMSAYVKRYDRQTKWIYFLIEENEFIEKYKVI